MSSPPNRVLLFAETIREPRHRYKGMRRASVMAGQFWSISACFAAAIAPAAESLPRSVLILDQSATSSVWYAAFSPVFRSTLNAGSAKRISIYEEHLKNISRFGGPRSDELLRNYLREEFQRETDRLTGGPGVLHTLDFVLRSRDDALGRGACGLRKSSGTSAAC